MALWRCNVRGSHVVERRLDGSNRFVHEAVRAVAADVPLPAPPSGEAWLRRAAQHGVLSLLAAHLPPEAAPGPLVLVRRARSLHHLRALAGLRTLTTEFNSAGIEWLVFKGPVLSEHVYRRPGARGYGDIDLLVRPDDVAGAVAVLERLGSQALDGGWKLMQAIGNGESAYELPGGVVIDLHWDVINDCRRRLAFEIAPDTLFRRSQFLQIAGIAVRTFDPIDTVLHVAMHACHSGGDRLRWLLDIQQAILNCERPLHEIFDRAVSMRLDLVLRIMLNRMEAFVGGLHAAGGLPHLTGFARSWVGLDAAVMNRFPPGARYEGRYSAAIVSTSTRSAPLPSWCRLLAVLPSTLWARGRWRAVLST
jgi:putative nucleotidyltransferase-like protein